MGWPFKKKLDHYAEIRAAAAVVMWQRCAAFLENYKLPVGDVNDLPFSKEVLEVAFPLALERAGSPSLIEAMGMCYMALANFQPLSIEEKVAVGLNFRAMIDAKSASEDEMDGVILVISKTGEIVKPILEKIAQEISVRRQRLTEVMKRFS